MRLCRHARGQPHGAGDVAVHSGNEAGDGSQHGGEAREGGGPAEAAGAGRLQERTHRQQHAARHLRHDPLSDAIVFKPVLVLLHAESPSPRFCSKCGTACTSEEVGSNMQSGISGTLLWQSQLFSSPLWCCCMLEALHLDFAGNVALLTPLQELAL